MRQMRRELLLLQVLRIFEVRLSRAAPATVPQLTLAHL
jgi:hypothetical protein